MAESKEELKSLMMKVKEESENAGLNLNIQKTMIILSGPITSWQIDGETMETVTDFIFLVPKITADCDFSHKIKRCLFLGRKAMYHQKMIPHIQGQRKSFKKAVEGAQSHLKSNLIPARDTQRA